MALRETHPASGGDEISPDLIRQLDARHVWHPVTQHAVLETRPLLLIREARGACVYDAEGREYLDAMAGLWCVNIGYGRKEVADAAYEQMLKLSYYPNTQMTEPAALLAEKVASIAPGNLERTFFTNSGSEAVETALKIARQYARQVHRGQNRYKVVARYRGYHGWTLGALSATGQMRRRNAFEPLVPGFFHARPPDCYRCPWGQKIESCELECADEVEEIIRFQGPETVAAVIAEPIIGGGGVIPSPEGYLQKLRAACDRYGVLLIFDEVITGFGRTGELFAGILYGVQADIMTMAKGLSSAYLPLAGTITTPEVFEAFFAEDDPEALLVNLSTFGGHPVACAAGLANLEVLLRERLWENARTVGAHLGQALNGLRELSCVGDVRGRGLLWAVEIVEDSGAPVSDAVMNQVLARCRQAGVIISKNAETVAGFANVITLAPPLVLTKDQADQIVKVLKEALTQVA